MERSYHTMLLKNEYIETEWTLYVWGYQVNAQAYSDKIVSFFTPIAEIHSDTHTRTTRLALSNLYLPRWKTQKLQNSFRYQGVKIWNSVSQRLKMLRFNQFKIKYKKIY